jgi:hypothetical protein
VLDLARNCTNGDSTCATFSTKVYHTLSCIIMGGTPTFPPTGAVLLARAVFFYHVLMHISPTWQVSDRYELNNSFDRLGNSTMNWLLNCPHARGNHAMVYARGAKRVLWCYRALCILDITFFGEHNHEVQFCSCRYIFMVHYFSIINLEQNLQCKRRASGMEYIGTKFP